MVDFNRPQKCFLKPEPQLSWWTPLRAGLAGLSFGLGLGGLAVMLAKYLSSR